MGSKNNRASLSFSKIKKSLRPSSIWKNLKSMDRNTTLVLSLTLILVIVGLVALTFNSDDDTEITDNTKVTVPTEQADLIEATITLQEGTVEYKTEETDWGDPNDTSPLVENESIRTVGAASRVIVTLETGSELRLDGNSEVQLTTLSKDRVVIRQVSGTTYNRVAPNDNTIYVVTSNEAQYEAQGTAFRAGVTGDEDYVEVFHSSVVETTSNTDVKEGERLVVDSRVNPADNGKIQRLSIENIKENVFIKWNRELDLQNDQFKNNLGFLSDFEAPDLNIKLSDGEIILLEPTAKNGTIEIEGTTTAGSTLKVATNGSHAVDVSVSDDGSFKTPVLTSPLGDTTFTFIASDQVGNKVEKSVRVTFQRKSASVIGSSTAKISLTGEIKGSSKVALSWTSSGGDLKAKDGFKVVYDMAPNPIYGEATSDLVTSNAWEKKISEFPSSGTFYFRVCVYVASTDTCNNYSSPFSLDI